MNPLLRESNHRFKTINFNEIKLEHFMPAINESIDIARNNISDIKSNTENPNFENTIVASDDRGSIKKVNKDGDAYWSINIYKKISKKLYKNLTFALY